MEKAYEPTIELENEIKEQLAALRGAKEKETQYSEDFGKLGKPEEVAEPIKFEFDSIVDGLNEIAGILQNLSDNMVGGSEDGATAEPSAPGAAPPEQDGLLKQAFDNSLIGQVTGLIGGLFDQWR